MESLLKIGFRRVGQWLISDGKPVLSLEAEQGSHNILYSFVSDGEILYIGKTAQSLSKRMYGYQNPGPLQRTNLRNNKLIAETLRAQKPVDIYALPDNGLLYYGGFHVNLAAGLEDSLISELSPTWNKSGKAM
jgi:hypothetical protein